MFSQKKIQNTQFATYSEPVISKVLFASKLSVPLWTIARIYLGYIWLLAGWSKVTSSAWVGSEAGTAITGFLQHSLTLTTGEHPSVQIWYAWLIENIFLPNAGLTSEHADCRIEVFFAITQAQGDLILFQDIGLVYEVAI